MKAGTWGTESRTEVMEVGTEVTGAGMEAKSRTLGSLPYSTILQKNRSLELLKSTAYTGRHPTMHFENDP